MLSKLTKFALAATVIAAFALPASASAGPVLTSADNPGVPVPVNSTFEMTSTNFVVDNGPLGGITCEHWIWNAKVIANSGSDVGAVGIGGSSEGCDTPSGSATITAPTLTSFVTNQSGKGTAAVTFIVDVGPVECHYTGSGPANYVTGSDVLSLIKVRLHADTPLCEDEEEDSTLSADFTMTTTNGTPLLIS